MADSEESCDGCQRSACGDTIRLLCGHLLCAESSYEPDSMSLLCPVCVAYTSTTYEIQSDCEANLNDRDQAMDVSDKEEMDITQEESVQTNFCKTDCEKENLQTPRSNNVDVIDPKNVCKKIEEALIISKRAFQQLDEALQTVKNLEDRSKEAKDRAIEMVKQEFKKIALELSARKCKLIAEIKANREVYSGDLAKAVENIMEKKSSLEARVTIAKTVLKSPSESTYCNLDQLVALLKENFEKERLVSDSLKSCCNVRFCILIKNIAMFLNEPCHNPL
ncbi:uncharacterized protein LOC134583421 [Pelobates fuscus]|uniref:uncharacterized protein LOC134583421 n=1 Tax=Pelobates fuscus TaxID=191477 RepID=UPI002FE4BA4B